MLAVKHWKQRVIQPNTTASYSIFPSATASSGLIRMNHWWGQVVAIVKYQQYGKPSDNCITGMLRTSRGASFMSRLIFLDLFSRKSIVHFLNGRLFYTGAIGLLPLQSNGFPFWSRDQVQAADSPKPPRTHLPQQRTVVEQDWVPLGCGRTNRRPRERVEVPVPVLQEWRRWVRFLHSKATRTVVVDRELNSAVKARTFAFDRLSLFLEQCEHFFSLDVVSRLEANVPCYFCFLLFVLQNKKRTHQMSQRQKEHFFSSTQPTYTAVASAAPPSNVHRLQMLHLFKGKQITFPPLFDFFPQRTLTTQK